jgi:hypothetical protein
MFPIQIDLKQGDTLLLLLLKFPLEYDIKNVQESQEGLELNGTHDFLLYADVNLLGENVNELP